MSNRTARTAIQACGMLLAAFIGAGLVPACAVNPTPDPNPLVADAGDDLFATENDTLTLTASASGGSPPYIFRWNVEVVPEGEQRQPVSEDPQVGIDTSSLVVGRYQYRVRVTDGDGNTATDFVTIEVGPEPTVARVPEAGEAGQPATLAVGEPFTLMVDPNRSGDFTYAWTRVSGAEVEFSDEGAAETQVTPAESGEVTIRANITDPDSGHTFGDEITLVILEGDRARVVMTIESGSPGVEGDVTFELFEDLAPQTVDNLLRYVDDQFYDGLAWHRVVPDFVVQTGGFTRSDADLVHKEAVYDPVKSETNNGVSNLPGTVAMALTDGDPDSGTTQFFVNLADNSRLDETFTVLGHVVEGMEIIEAMAAVETGTANVQDEDVIEDVPVEDISIVTFRRRVE